MNKLHDLLEETPATDGNTASPTETCPCGLAGDPETCDHGEAWLNTPDPDDTPTRPTYRERRMAKAERLREWAEKREVKAEAADAKARQIADMIPFGQPILAGHHSQGRHMRDLERINSGYDKSYEHAKKAENFRNRADGIEAAAERAIYSDDPDAVVRIEERISELEAERDRIKAYNASCRKGTPDWDVLSDEQQAQHRRTLEVAAWQCKNGAFPSYALSNLSGNIKRNRDRLAQLSA